MLEAQPDAGSEALRRSSARMCRHCHTPLPRTVVVDLGMPPLCETFPSADELDEMELFHPYFSSSSASWLHHAERYVATVVERLALGPDSFVVEPGSNDGYLICGTTALAQERRIAEKQFDEHFSYFSFTAWGRHAQSRRWAVSPRVAALRQRKAAARLTSRGYFADFATWVDRNPYGLARAHRRSQSVQAGTVHAGDPRPDPLAGGHQPHAPPDSMLILPWNLTAEIIEHIGHIRDWGAQFVVPIAELKVIL
jgi:hypothetical protein